MKRTWADLYRLQFNFLQLVIPNESDGHNYYLPAKQRLYQTLKIEIAFNTVFTEAIIFLTIIIFAGLRIIILMMIHIWFWRLRESLWSYLLVTIHRENLTMSSVREKTLNMSLLQILSDSTHCSVLNLRLPRSVPDLLLICMYVPLLIKRTQRPVIERYVSLYSVSLFCFDAINILKCNKSKNPAASQKIWLCYMDSIWR